MIEIREPEYICPVCGRTYDRYKALFGHMMKTHRAEFEEHGRTLSAYGIHFDPYERIVREIRRIEGVKSE